MDLLISPDVRLLRGMDEPVRAALARLRELDARYMETTPVGVADAEIYSRMRILPLAVTAIDELGAMGDDDPSADRIVESMIALRDAFVFDPGLLLEMAEAAVAEGEDEDAHTLRMAFEWHRRRAWSDTGGYI